MHQSLSDTFTLLPSFQDGLVGRLEKSNLNMTKSTRKAASATSPQSPLPYPLDAYFLSLSLFFCGNLKIVAFYYVAYKREVSIDACSFLLNNNSTVWNYGMAHILLEQTFVL